MAVRDIVISQKKEFERKQHERYIDRDAQIREIDSGLVNVIIGPRRAGKSSFVLHQVARAGNTGYVNFDDERLAGIQEYDEIIAAVDEVYGKPEFLFFDEIQNIPKWEIFVNRLHREGRRLIITGSNSNLLSAELSTHLTGRHTQTTILPFSFGEYLTATGDEKTQKHDLLRKYAETGGFPEPLVKNLDHRDYLSTLFDSIVYKDIVKRFRIRYAAGLDDLAQYLLANIAHEYSYNTLAKLTKCKSAHTVQKYLGYLEEAYLFFSLPRFSWKYRAQVSANKKIYCIDNGIVTAKSFQFSENRGQLLENLVAVELKRREIQEKTRIFYWKNQDQHEVDFVVFRRNKIDTLIQVCYDMGTMKTRERELRSLVLAGKELNCDNLLMLTDKEEGSETVSWFGAKGTVIFQPVWKWLLADTTR